MAAAWSRYRARARQHKGCQSMPICITYRIYVYGANGFIRKTKEKQTRARESLRIGYANLSVRVDLRTHVQTRPQPVPAEQGWRKRKAVAKQQPHKGKKHRNHSIRRGTRSGTRSGPDPSEHRVPGRVPVTDPQRIRNRIGRWIPTGTRLRPGE